MKRITLFLALAVAPLSASICYATDNLPLMQCLSQADAVDFASQCIIAGGTSSTCENGQPKCCKKYSDGSVVCVSNPRGVTFEKLKPAVVPQTPTRPIEKP